MYMMLPVAIQTGVTDLVIPLNMNLDGYVHTLIMFG